MSRLGKQKKIAITSSSSSSSSSWSSSTSSRGSAPCPAQRSFVALWLPVGALVQCLPVVACGRLGWVVSCGCAAVAAEEVSGVYKKGPAGASSNRDNRGSSNSNSNSSASSLAPSWSSLRFGSTSATRGRRYCPWRFAAYRPACCSLLHGPLAIAALRSLRRMLLWCAPAAAAAGRCPAAALLILIRPQGWRAAPRTVSRWHLSRWPPSTAGSIRTC